MRDPERLINAGATDFERLLVRGAANERPSPELGQRMYVGLERLLDSRTAAGAAAWSIPWMWIGAVAVVASGLAALAFVTLQGRAPRPAATPSLAFPALPALISDAPANGAEGLAAGIAPAAEPDTRVAEPSLSAVQGPTESKPRGARPAKPPAPDAPVASGDLRAEMLLLRRARAGIREHDGARALSELRDYAMHFPNGTFSPEAMVLRVEALDLEGQHAQAVTLGRRFLSAYADSPFADRVERVTKAESLPSR
jgi:hypothetical protein